MPRLQPVAAEDYTPEQKRIADMISGQRKAPVRGPFGVLLHAPEICEMFANFVDLSLDEDKSRIPLRLKIYDVAKELAETRQLSDANYQRAIDHFGKEAMVELAALVGFYHTVSVVLNVFQVEAPEGDPHPLKG